MFSWALMSRLNILFLCLLSSQAFSAPRNLSHELGSALSEAGANRSALESVLATVPSGEKARAEFLIANLPPCDLVQAKPEVLLEHLAYADTARQVLPWADKVPEDVFLHYVLPPRVSQEPLEAWRKYLYEQLLPVVLDCKTMEAAAYEVNRWCAERVKYKPTSPRDQGPFETLRSGYGRCEEMAIVYISALRSVGIPARMAWTPWWSTSDNNHAWVEVWADEKWQYTGACEPQSKLCQAWFDAPVKRAGLVLTESFGVPEDGKDVYKKGPCEAILNVSSNYARTGNLKVKVISQGKSQGKAMVWVSVFNYGGLRPISKRESDARGGMALELGQGTYVLSSQTKKGFAYKVAQVEAGKAKTDTLSLAPLDGALLSERFQLTYPKPEGK